MQPSLPPPPPPPFPPTPPLPEIPPPEARVAQKVLKETLRLKRGENLVIETWTHTLPLATAFVLEARKIGAHPLVLFEDEATYWKSIEVCSPKDLGKVGDHEWALLAKADAYVFLWGPRDRPRLRSLGPKVLEALQGYNGEWYARAGRAHLRAARMEVGRATEEASRHFNVALGPWQQELLDATLVGTAEMVREGARLAKALRRGRVLTVDHPNGTRLELRLRGRSPRVEDGVVSPQDVAEGNNMTSVPSGWVAVALDERFAEGTFHADRPSFLPAHRAEGGEWTFQGGHLTSYRYRSGGEAFSTPYEKAPKKGRDLVGYLSIGLNPKIAAAPQLEDQARGVVCLTVGRNDELGGSTRVPFLSWLVLGGANVTVDGRPLLRAGDIV